MEPLPLPGGGGVRGEAQRPERWLNVKAFATKPKGLQFPEFNSQTHEREGKNGLQ